MKKKLVLFLTALTCTALGFSASYVIFLYHTGSKFEKVNKTIEIKSKNIDDDRSIKLPVDESQEKAIEENGQIKISSEHLPEKFNLKWDILFNNTVLKEIKRDHTTSFPEPKEYSYVEGITCFRGNNFRNSPSYGYADIKEEKLEKVWSAKTGFIDIWTGVGWTGQPAIVKWPDSTRKIMNLYPDKKSKEDLKEVIYATLDGKIYFLDVDDGMPTRPALNIGYPHKGSVTVEPRGYPLLYAGQGIEQVGGKPVPIGYRIFSLIDQKLLYFINGYDPFAFRKWGAFDSNGLIDKKSDTLIECGENGILYSVKLNTKYEPEKRSITINPEITRYRYFVPKGSHQIGTENSPAFYKNYVCFADNGGLLQCLNINTLKPLWVRSVNDDTDSSIAIEEINESTVYLYTACEVDKQGEGGSSYIRKINALTGELIWEKSYRCSFDAKTNGGTLASPVIGKHEIQNLVIYNIAKAGSKSGGKLIAFDKNSGKEIWVQNLKYYCWSSPVDVYTKDGKAYIIVCDSGGIMSLIDGKTGKVLDRISLEANIEASPAAYGSMVVVGTRGQKIWGVKIK